MIHIAILMPKYADMILDGSKTVECRLTRQARVPFEAIEPGERIYFKQSSGPYRATAVADHVQFERDLTAQRLRQIHRDYNDAIRGDAEYWKLKTHSRFATLIWLRDVKPVDTGPAVRRSQGIAWLTLEEEPVWRRHHATTVRGASSNAGTAIKSRDSFLVEVTAGNLRNNSLYVTKVIDRFPRAAIGGKTKRDAADPITLMLHDGPTVQTDIVGPRNLFRSRVWGTWFRRHGAQPGDQVIFTPISRTKYHVGLLRGKGASA